MHRFELAKRTVQLIVFFFLAAASTFLFAQSSGSIRYFYDDLGRLVRVVDQNGNSATYTYDAVGNILSITRSTIPANNGLAIFNFTPQSGSAGQTVTIQGQGFSTTIASNSVEFNGTAATVISASDTALTVTVPTGAATGPISVSVSGTSASSDAKFTVIAPIASITVSPSGISLRPLGQQQQFTATATLSDGTHQDVTASAVWSSLNPTVAVVSNAPGSKGLVTSAGDGSASIVASSGNVSGSTPITVVPFASITVTPAPATVQLGSTQQFTASATFSDGTKQDITTQADWTSTPTVMSVSNTPGSQGLGTALGVGQTEVCANPPSSTHISGCSAITVPLELASITISPADTSAPKGTTQQFTANGSYNNNTFQDLTAIATWSSSDPTVATISNSPGSAGLATEVGTGTTTISATDGSVVGSTTLTLTAPLPVSVSISPGRLVLQSGSTLQLAAKVVLTDNTSQDVTQTATWNSSNPTVATVDNTGSLTTTGLGNTKITATSGGIAGAAAVIVTTPQAVGLSRFGYVTNTDSTISVYTVNAGTGQFRPNGYAPFFSGRPQAVILDPTSRFLYVATSFPNSVSAYQVNAEDGSLTEIGGSPFAVGDSPIALAIDPSGKFLFVSNQSDDTVSAFAIDPSSGALSPISGSPFAVGNVPAGLAVDPSGQLLYVANQSSNSISVFTIDSATGALAEVAGSPFPIAETGPTAIAADPKGRFIYVANRGQGGGSATELLFPKGFQLREATSPKSSDLSQIQATHPIYESHLNGPKFRDLGRDSLALQSHETGRVLIASIDPARSSIFGGMAGDMEAEADSITLFPAFASFGSSRLFAQIGIVTGPSISVFALDANGVPTEIPGSPFSVPNAPNSIVADPTGSFVYELDGNEITGFAVNPTSGALTQLDGSPYTTEFSSSALNMDPSGQFLYAEGQHDTQEFAVDESTGNVTLSGTFPNRNGTGSAVSKGTTALAYVPQYAYLVSSGNTLSGAGGGANNISGYSVDPATGSLTALPASPFAEGLFPELGISDPLGRFFYLTNDCSDLACSAPKGSVSGYTISASTGVLSLISGSPFSVGTSPRGIVVDPTGQFLYVANQGNNTISAYGIDQTLGTLTTIAGSPFAMPSGSSGVTALAIDSEGLWLYAADQGGKVWVFSIATSGAIAYPSQILSGLSGIQAFAADPMGRFLVVPDGVSNDIAVLSTSRGGNYYTSAPGSPFPTDQKPVSVAIDPTGRFVYVANQGSNDISAYTLDPVAGTLTQIPGSPFAAGTSPVSLSVDISGKFLYVVNEGNNSISSYSIDPTSGTLTPLAASPLPTGTAPVSITTTGKIQ